MMNRKTFVVAMRPNSKLIKVAVTVMIAMTFALVSTSSTAYAAKKKKVKYGQIEISTNPGGFPLKIDGQAQGDTSQTVRVIELEPGHHNLEILLPNGGRWVRDFDVERGRKVCVNLNYHPKKFTVTSSPCPYPVNISAPVSVNDGDLFTFTADVAYSGSAPLNYTWTVSPAGARIVSGTGTPTIAVDSTGLGSHRVSATLVVDDGSGDRSCRQNAQASTTVVGKVLTPVECRPFDQFPSIAFDDTKARLDNLAIELQNSPDMTAYIIIYAGRTSRAGQADMLGRRTMDYLTTTRGVDARRIVIINDGYRDSCFIEVWICLTGSKPPQPTPTVQPGDVQPARERTRPRKPRRRGDE